jgi:fructose-bisphosphate aldolase, class II
MLCHIKQIINDSIKGGYAVGSFNVHNFETALGVAQAALKAKSPAIIQVSEGAIKYMGLKPITHIVSTLAKNIATYTPIALHLDHGKKIETIFECINAGFTSVHIDASDLPLDENIALSKTVVEMAHAKNVWVQGEVGYMVGGHGKKGEAITIPLADPDEVIRFAKESGVDTVAAAIGTAHGVYDNETIRMELLKKIKDAIKIPFVLHGGSGLDDAIIKEGIKNGINVINIGSDIKIAFCKTLIRVCAQNSEETDPRKLLKPTIDAVKDVVADKMELFGSAGQVIIQSSDEIAV